MPCSAQNVETAPLGASSGHRAIARRTRGSMGSLVAIRPPSGQKCHHQDHQNRHRRPDAELVTDVLGDDTTTAATLPGAWAPADPGTLRCSATRSASAARWANAITGTRPALDTRFGSSKRADFTWQTRTYRMPFPQARMDPREVLSSQVRRAFASHDPPMTATSSADPGSVRDPCKRLCSTIGSDPILGHTFAELSWRRTWVPHDAPQRDEPSGRVIWDRPCPRPDNRHQRRRPTATRHTGERPRRPPRTTTRRADSSGISRQTMTNRVGCDLVTGVV